MTLSGSDLELQSAWRQFCTDLMECGNDLFQDAVPSLPELRAESFRYLAQAVALGFEMHIENKQPMHPYLMRYFSPWRKQAGDNPDAFVHGAWIDGKETYRIVGNRGSVRWINITALRERDHPGGPLYEMGSPYNLVLDAKPLPITDMQFEYDGSFAVTLSPDPHPGNWIETTDRTCAVRIRQFFGDWEHDNPMTARIERVGESGTPSLRTPARFIDQLREVAAFVKSSAAFWPTGMPMESVNEMVARVMAPPSSDGSWSGQMDINTGGVNGATLWKLAFSEAMVIRFRPPDAYFWSFELDNVWAASMDYRYHLSSLNSEQAVLDPDGLATVVVSHIDPGVPNWLDVSGWTAGSLNFRALICEEVPHFTTAVLSAATLDSVLVPGTVRIDDDYRRQQMKRRKAGVDKRFGG